MSSSTEGSKARSIEVLDKNARGRRATQAKKWFLLSNSVETIRRRVGRVMMIFVRE